MLALRSFLPFAASDRRLCFCGQSSHQGISNPDLFQFDLKFVWVDKGLWARPFIFEPATRQQDIKRRSGGVRMSVDIVTRVQAELLKEACASPQLLSDIAQLEGYISETYSDRSFVELLQNADDAGASKFAVHLSESQIICANDGRPFSESDLRSICRSGASNKKKGETIGYRGIGFKSVAALADRVKIISGGISTVFDKDLTAVAIGLPRDKVPLIRIPHSFDIKRGDELDAALESLRVSGMTTFFIFQGIDLPRTLNDLNSIRDDSLLFLRSVEEIALNIMGDERSFRCRRSTEGSVRGLLISAQADTQEWEIIRRSSIDFAFSKSSGARVPLHGDQAAVHAFLPTNEQSGLGIRINADFSTDPSRTRIVLDENTMRLISDAASEIVDMLDDILASEQPDRGTLSCLAANIDLASVDLMRPCFRTEMIRALRQKAKGRFGSLALRPAWLNPTDYRTLAEAANLTHLPKLQSDEADEALHLTMKALGARPPEDAKLLSSLDPTALSDQGKSEISAYAKKLKDLGSPQAAVLLDIPGLGAVVDGNSMTLREAFQAQTHNQTSSLVGNDILFAPEVDRILQPPASDARPGPENTVSVSRWRHGENVVGEVFRGQGYDVEDHSRQNLGYDLLARKGSEIFYIEVKTINRAGEPFILTTNEEAVARDKGEQYLIALQREIPGFVELAILRDPAGTLRLDRQCRQWVWECSVYSYEPRKFATS